MNRPWLVLVLASTSLAQNPQFLPDQNRPCWQLQPADSWAAYRQILLADLDGDGDGDAVTESNAGLAVHRQGTAPVWTYTLLPNAVGSSVPVGCLVDINGDGHLDILTSGHTPPTLYAPAQVGVQSMRNNGNAAFNATAVQSLPLNLVPHRIAAGDLDGDGDQDLVIAQLNGTTLFLRQQGGTLVSDPTFIPFGAGGYRELVALDCDGDADIDILATTAIGSIPGSIDLLRNVGATLNRTTNVLAGPALQVGVGDIDGDGDVDCVTRTATAIVTHGNDGGGTFTVSSAITRADATSCLAVGRIDGNTFADTLVGWDHPVLSGLAYMGSATGLQADPMVDRIAPPTNVNHAALPLNGVDLNGDGRQDHLNLVADLAGNSWVRTLTAGRFGAVTSSQFSVFFNNPRSAGAVDLDGDSDLDIIATTHVDDLFWTTNTGNTFGPPTSLNIFAVSAAAWGDVDGDGDVDLIEVHDFLPAVVRLNDGSGTFSAGTALPETGWVYSRAALLGDLDGDGDLDAVTGRGASGCLDVLRNLGNGSFVLQPGCPYSTNSPPNGMRSADFDGDGDLDIVQWNAADTRLMINSGAATFTNETATRLLPLPSSNVSDVVVFDADADGDPDLLLLRNGMLQLLYENDGNGVFTEVSFQRWSQVPNGSSGATADLDGDGDQDVIVGQQIAWNHLRQLSSVEEPRLGGSLTLRLHLEPDRLAAGFALVAIAFQPLPTPFSVPGISGIIELVAAGHLPLVSMPAPLGVADQSLQIPLVPSLLGIDLYCQALFLSSPTGIAVSNALHERLR